MPNIKPNAPKEYLSDHRLPVLTLFTKFNELTNKFKFTRKLIFKENINSKIILPCNSFTSTKQGKSLWIISGVHGEEPAGPNAIAERIEQLGIISNSIPLVILPLCNPKGYFLNWRYANQAKYSKHTIGKSVGDSEHFLSKLIANAHGPRAKQPSCRQSRALTSHILALIKKYPPVLCIDLHEDNQLKKGYIYSQGPKGAKDKIAQAIVEIFVSANYPLFQSGKTRFDQQIINGIISSIADGSIDELLAARKIFYQTKFTSGPAAKSVIVIETSAYKHPISKRIKAHKLIIDNLEKLWALACQQLYYLPT